MAKGIKSNLDLSIDNFDRVADILGFKDGKMKFKNFAEVINSSKYHNNAKLDRYCLARGTFLLKLADAYDIMVMRDMSYLKSLYLAKCSYQVNPDNLHQTLNELNPLVDFQTAKNIYEELI